MLKIFSTAILFAGIFANIEAVELDVYYESLCPDSRRFIVNQLEPLWQEMSPYVSLRLIPFGKASYLSKPEGGWSFTCQHGPSECSGNILHACGIKYSSDINQTVTYASCLMQNPDSGALCAEKAGLDYAAVDQCFNAVEGEDLVHDHGVETLNLQPTLTFVPWLVFDKQWNADNQWDGLQDLRSVLCSLNDGSILPCNSQRKTA